MAVYDFEIGQTKRNIEAVNQAIASMATAVEAVGDLEGDLTNLRAHVSSGFNAPAAGSGAEVVAGLKGSAEGSMAALGALKATLEANLSEYGRMQAAALERQAKEREEAARRLFPGGGA